MSKNDISAMAVYNKPVFLPNAGIVADYFTGNNAFCIFCVAR
jgi:hypothetical protein